MLQKLKFGRITNFDDYLKNGNEQEISKVLQFLKEQQQGIREADFPDRVHTEEALRANTLMEGLIEKVGLYAVEKKTISIAAIKDQFSVDENRAEAVIKYLKSMGLLGDKDALGNFEVKYDKQGFKKHLQDYQRLADRIKAVSASKNMNMVDITITRKLIAEENDHAIKTYIPGSKGKCLWINKENAISINNDNHLYLLPLVRYFQDT